MAETQNYQNHVRWYPLVHFFLTPIFLFNIIWQAVRLYQEPNWDRAESLLLAIAFIGLQVAARLQALKAQDRVIRLEERLRYREILPADLATQTENLKIGQILALRFASDEELPELVRKTLSGELKTNKEIKQAIKNWRGDYLRV
jgi:Family of unknown function (DUF6526)